MDKTQLAGFIRSNTGITEVLEGKQFCEITVEPEELHKTAALLREDENLRFNFLACLTGVDWGKELGVVYHLRSTVLNHTIVLKTKTADRDNPV
ncbi:MAG: NADH-quinone oxidoreductase subunit C, partial [Bacteroidales bacterium]|nr:NADH-quinone oxidoreductase subunit C [Bacteroidales bacterium]